MLQRIADRQVYFGLDRETYDVLVEIAEKRRCRVAQVIREMIWKILQEKQDDQI